MFGFGIRLMLKIKFGLKLIGWFSLIEFKLKARGIASTQKAVLQDILNTSKDTEFGKKYHFGAILDEKLQEDLLNNFQKIVPVSEHSNFEFYIERCKSGHVDVLFPAKPKFFVTAYSVLNKPKWIPISNKYYQEVFYRINAVWFYNLLKINSKTFNGPMIPALSGCVSGTTLNGTVYTSAPAYTQKEAPFFLQSLFAFPPEVFSIEDPIARYYTILRFSLEKDIHLLVAQNPIYLQEMQLCLDTYLEDLIIDIQKGSLSDKISIQESLRESLELRLKANPKRAMLLENLKKEHSRLLPKMCWPNLQIVTLWKTGNAKYFYEQIKSDYPSSCVFIEQGYNVAECEMGVVLDPKLDSTVLFPHKNFFEFVREKDLNKEFPRYFLLHEVKEEEVYSVFVTTHSGLYRYALHDLIRVKGFYNNVPTIEFVRKQNGFVSIMDEELRETQFIQAVCQVEIELAKKTSFFIGFADLKNQCYHFYFEFFDQKLTKAFVERFVSRVDFILKSKNLKYAIKRNSGSLSKPKAYLLQPYSYEVFKSRIIEQKMYKDEFRLYLLLQDDLRHAMIQKLIKKKHY